MLYEVITIAYDRHPSAMQRLDAFPVLSDRAVSFLPSDFSFENDRFETR